MSKIIFSFGSLAQGGAERVCSNLSYVLADHFDKVIMVAWCDQPLFYEYDKRTKWLCVEKEIGSSNDYKRMAWYRKLVKKEKPDLILSFQEPYNIRVLVSTIGLDVKTIVAERNDPHGVNKYWIIDQFEKFVYKRADKILVQTETIKKFFDGDLKNKTHVIYNPVNLPTEWIGLSLKTAKKKRVVSVARLKPQKNHDVLIKAFAQFYKTHKEYTLTIYGEGPQRKELQSLADSLNIGDKVLMPGASKNIHQDILDADMMCLVSSRKGMSNAMIESMCLGLPCICTKVSGAIDLIRDGENGLLVDVGDVDELLSCMNRIADNDDMAYAIGQKASELYQIVNKDKIYEEWISFLKRQLITKE